MDAHPNLPAPRVKPLKFQWHVGRRVWWHQQLPLSSVVCQPGVIVEQFSEMYYKVRLRHGETTTTRSDAMTPRSHFVPGVDDLPQDN